MLKTRSLLIISVLLLSVCVSTSTNIYLIPVDIKVMHVITNGEEPVDKESEVKRFMLLHFGFEKPTPEIMAAWQNWFGSIADQTVENGGFHGGAREISHSGTTDLAMGMDSITGYSIINAESLEDAEKIARDNPFIASIRVYEILTM